MELGDLKHPFIIRDLEPSDYEKGHLKLLEQLTKVGDISGEAFTKRVEEIGKLGDHHRIVVIEDVERQKIVATATLLVELKIARNCGKVGHIEDVVVDQTVRGQSLGQRYDIPSGNFLCALQVGEGEAGIDALGTAPRVGFSFAVNLEDRVVCHLADSAKQLGCYKVILDCTETNAPFYEKCGFTRKELQMAHYF